MDIYNTTMNEARLNVLEKISQAQTVAQQKSNIILEAAEVESDKNVIGPAAVSPISVTDKVRTVTDKEMSPLQARNKAIMDSFPPAEIPPEEVTILGVVPGTQTNLSNRIAELNNRKSTKVEKPEPEPVKEPKTSLVDSVTSSALILEQAVETKEVVVEEPVQETEEIEKQSSKESYQTEEPELDRLSGFDES